MGLRQRVVQRLKVPPIQHSHVPRARGARAGRRLLPLLLLGRLVLQRLLPLQLLMPLPLDPQVWHLPLPLLLVLPLLLLILSGQRRWRPVPARTAGNLAHLGGCELALGLACACSCAQW